jgi:hypothetical protein
LKTNHLATLLRILADTWPRKAQKSFVRIVIDVIQLNLKVIQDPYVQSLELSWNLTTKHCSG